MFILRCPIYNGYWFLQWLSLWNRRKGQTIHHMPILTSACATRPWWVNEWLVIDVGEIFSFLLINNKLGVPGVASYWGQPCVHKSIQPTNQVFWASAPTALTYFPPGLYYTRWCNINCHGICMQSDDWMYLPYECNTNVVPDHLHAEWWLNVPPL